ncbi:hypothetical protein [Actinokineospora sp.]|uniref:hypothetical protein n=1 Tax=Actinokineospora sp. TaxID=1872133 RepID=UPI004037E28D
MQELSGIRTHIQAFRCVDTWNVLEFSPSGAGYRTRQEHELPVAEWELVAELLQAAATVRPRLAPLGVRQKKALYAMVSADGYAYRAAESPSTPIADEGRIGSILGMHLSDIAAGWHIDPIRHQQRYAGPT